MPKEAIRIMKNLLVSAWLCLVLASCTAGTDYQKSLGSWMNFSIITTAKDYQRVLNSWLGYDIETLMRRWGYPTIFFEMPNGNTIYGFNRLDERQSVLIKSAATLAASQICAGNTRLCLNSIQRRSRFFPDNMQPTPFKSMSGFTSLPEYISLAYDSESENKILNYLCETLFEVDIDNSIAHWSYRGDDCY